MINVLLIWTWLGLLGWCSFALSSIIEDGLTATIKGIVSECLWNVGFFVVCVAGGCVTLIMAVVLPRN